nr:hypothetical protein [Tanacetum cinerariifolium]
MVELDDEIKVLGEINLELQSSTHKVIKKLSQKKILAVKKLREKLSHEEDTEEEAFEEFSLTQDNVLENLRQENESPGDFYGLMYDTDDDVSISEKSCEHFGWDWDSPGTKVDWQDDPLNETEEFFVGLDQPIQVVVAQYNVYEEVAEGVIEMANDQAEVLSFDKEVTDECLNDEQVKERRPSKRIRATQ